MKYLNRNMIESLDAIFMGSPDRMRTDPIKRVKIKNKIQNLDSLLIFAIIKENNLSNDLFPTPVFSIGNPKVEISKDSPYYDGFYDSFHAMGISDDGCLNTRFETIYVKNGKHKIYAGHGQHIDVTLLENPIRFDPSRRLIYLRSPNGKFRINSLPDKIKLTEELELANYWFVEEDNKINIYNRTPETADFVEDMWMESKVPRRTFLRDVGNVKFLTIVELNKEKEDEVFKRYIIPYNENPDLKTLTQENCQFEEDTSELYKSKQKSSKKEYSLSYINMKEVMQNHTWAFNYGYGPTIWNEHNQHLFE